MFKLVLQKNIFNLVLQEELAKKNNLIVSNVGRFYCKAENLNGINLKNENLFPSKPHRIFNVKFSAKLLVYLTDKIIPEPEHSLRF